MATKPDAGEKLIASNKKAFHDYFVLQKAEAGVALTGTEVKSLRDGKANLKDSLRHLQRTARPFSSTRTSRRTRTATCRTTSRSGRASSCCTGARSRSCTSRSSRRG